LEFIS